MLTRTVITLDVLAERLGLPNGHSIIAIVPPDSGDISGRKLHLLVASPQPRRTPATIEALQA
jgi:hypothetical protein